MAHVKAPSDLTDLFHFLEDIDLAKLNFSAKFSNDLFSVKDKYIKYLNSLLNNWFPKFKGCNDSILAQNLFIVEVETKKIKEWTKYQLFGLIQSVERIYNQIIDTKLEDRVRKSEIELLREISFESIPFIDYSHYNVEGKFKDFGFGKRNVIYSSEVYSASTMLIRKNITPKMLGEFMIPGISIFLLRQFIEIRVRKALGIANITNNLGKILNIPSINYIDILNHNDVTFPIDFGIVKNIHKWSNYFIHDGFVNYLWQIENAQFLLLPLFKGGSFGKQNDRFGSIKIKANYYNRIETLLKNFILTVPRFKKMNRKDILITRLPNPECIVIP